MKYLLLTFPILLFFSSCHSQQSDAKKVATDIQQTREENTPGSIPTATGGLTMKATIAGKPWEANSMMPPEAASRIIGYHQKISISLPYDRRYLYVGKKITFSDHQAVDLFTNDDIGIWGGRKGVMEITKVDDNWAEGSFYFTATTTEHPDKSVEVTDGFFRVPVPKGR
jgi:hypothetical protein